MFLRTWYPVDILKYYNPVTSLLTGPEEWKGMKTIKQIRRERHIPIPTNENSEYKEIQRRTQTFAPLVIPKSLEKSLPFELQAHKAKNATPQSLLSRRSVIMEPKERKVFNLIQQINTIKNDKLKKKKEERANRLAKHLKQKQESELKQEERQRNDRKRVYKMEGILELKKQRAEKRQKYDPKSS